MWPPSVPGELWRAAIAVLAAAFEMMLPSLLRMYVFWRSRAVDSELVEHHFLHLVLFRWLSHQSALNNENKLANHVPLSQKD